MLIHINGDPYNIADEDQVMIDILMSLDINVPRFCYHESLLVAGNCRMCLVDEEDAPKPLVCCALAPDKELNIFTDTVRVKKAREAVLEFLLINHPLDCPICDQGGECDLQDLTLVYGADRGRYYDYKRNYEDKNCGPIIKTIMNRCILCTRCVRFANDVAGFTAFGITGRGSKMEIGSYIERSISTDLSGNLVDLCPVGALTSKPYAFIARPWELDQRRLLNILDDELQLLRVDLRDESILRVLPFKNTSSSNTWITDRTRYGYTALSKNRLLAPSMVLGNKVSTVSWSRAVELFSFHVGIAAKSNTTSRTLTPFIATVAGNHLDCADLLAISKLTHGLGSCYLLSALRTKNNFIWHKQENEERCGSSFIIFEVDLPWVAPITNIKLKAALHDTDHWVAFWRSHVGLVFSGNSINLGNTPAAVYRFLSGKHWLCLGLQDPSIVLTVTSSTVGSISNTISILFNTLLLRVLNARHNYLSPSGGVRNQAALGGGYSKPISTSGALPCVGATSSLLQYTVSGPDNLHKSHPTLLGSGSDDLFSFYQGVFVPQYQRSYTYLFPTVPPFLSYGPSMYYDPDYRLVDARIQPFLTDIVGDNYDCDKRDSCYVTSGISSSLSIKNSNSNPHTVVAPVSTAFSSLWPPFVESITSGFTTLTDFKRQTPINLLGSYRSSNWTAYYKANPYSRSSSPLSTLNLEKNWKTIY